MALRRRSLLGWLAGAAALAATPLFPLLDRLLPRRAMRALRGARYPGPVRELRPEDIERPSRWSG